MLSVDSAVTVETLSHWDYLHTTPLDPLVAQAERSATNAGRTLIEELRRGDLASAFTQIVSSPRRRAAMLDPSMALGFSTLKRAIEEAPTAFTEGDRTLFSVMGARLATRRIQEAALDD